MVIDGKPLEQVTEADLRYLVENRIPEGKTLDYKENLPGNGDSEKIEYLADVTSFCNAAGGYLIYGIREGGGEATELVGLDITDRDAAVLRLENIMRDGVAPRLPGFQVRAIRLASGKSVVVVRAPRSWASPHMVSFKGHSRFYTRNSAGKYPLDVQELRAAFLASERVGERVRAFRGERLARLVARDAPVPLRNGATVVIHIIPLEAMDLAKAYQIDVKDEYLRPLHAASWSTRFNFDGLLSFSRSGNPPSPDSYVQVFRSGIIEGANTGMLEPEADGKLLIPSTLFEKEIIQFVGRSASLQQAIGVNPPLTIALSFIGVSGYTMAVSSRTDRGNPIDRDFLSTSEVLVDSFDFDIPRSLRPLFDAIWNAAGWEGSSNYDPDGQWKPMRW